MTQRVQGKLSTYSHLTLERLQLLQGFVRFSLAMCGEKKGRQLERLAMEYTGTHQHSSKSEHETEKNEGPTFTCRGS